MNVLIIAPLPPPLTGNSLPIKFLHDDLIKQKNNVTTINLNKKKYVNGLFSLDRIGEIISILVKVWRNKNDKDLIYLTVAESFLGNLRDIFIYIICFNKLDKIIIHMLGGAAMKDILTPSNKLQFKINKFFKSRLGGVIVEGQAQADSFVNVIDNKKIHINPNFAEDFLFTTEAQVHQNFSNLDTLRIIFLSNHLEGKGHIELVEGYGAVSPELQKKIKIDFVGNFPSEIEQNIFKDKIQPFTNIKYHGPLSGQAKKDIYTQAHVFCMPTYYPYEGQPFCILEAYATGCMVVTTNHSGIGQVFKNNKNGYEVEKKSISSVSSTLEKMANNKENLVHFALNNLREAEQVYNSREYLIKMRNIIKTIN